MEAREMVAVIDLAKIRPSRTNPRGRDRGNSIEDLTASVREHGVLQPILLRHAPEADTEYEIVFGHRRYAAAQAAVLRGIPAIVREISEVQALEMQVVENLQRADLHPLDEAAAYGELITHHKYDVARIAAHIGRSVAYVYDRVKLLKLVKDLRQHFLEGRFTPGHAVLLARLSPKDQARVLQQALYQSEASLFDPDEDAEGRDERTRRSFKPCSVRELQAWIDRHVRFDAREPDPMLFPETATRLEAAAENREKIIPITKASFIPEAAREGRTWFAASWRRADGERKSKPCEHSVTGFVAVGPGRGEAFKVCVAKEKCQVHWAKEIREKRARAAAAEKRGARPASKAEADDPHVIWKALQERDRRRREQWKKALPAALQAVAGAVNKAATQPSSVLGQLLIRKASGYMATVPAPAAKLFAPGNDAETTVRHAALILLWRDLENYHGFGGDLRAVKALGVDPAKILKAQREAEKKAEGEKLRGSSPAASPRKAGRAKQAHG